MRPAHQWDAIVVGTGFGGSMAALQLARGGKHVLVLERGQWVDRDDSAWDPYEILVRRRYQSTTPYIAPQFLKSKLVYPNEAVGGNSVFYGAASFRLREADFERRSRFAASSNAAHAYADWPITYADMEPHYTRAEQLLGVVGESGVDPTEPPRSAPYVGAPPAWGSPARRIASAAESLGLHPFHIPLAINYHQDNGRGRCTQCMTCDLFPCKLGAKNDLAVTVLPEALQFGATLRDRTVVTRLKHHRGRVWGVDTIDLRSGRLETHTGDVVILSAGAIPSPKLMLASGLDAVTPGSLIGRYLMRHCSGIVIGLFSDETNPEQKFHKQVAIADFYFGHPKGHQPAGPWGMLQALQVPPAEYIQSQAPFPVNEVGARTARRQIYLLCIAEDVPQSGNRVSLDPSRRDEFDVPVARVTHRYHSRDYAARRGLGREAARIIRRAGAWLRFRKPIYTFSHAVGSCRFGRDPEHAVLDPYCRVFGTSNLFVVDGSFMPTAGGTNPSLTIAANALRVTDHLIDNWAPYAFGVGE